MPPSKQFEGPTIEDALTAAATEFGSDVEVIEATKKREGGLFGFFARERFVIIAQRAEPDEPDTPDFGDLLLGMAAEIEDTYEETLEATRIRQPAEVDSRLSLQPAEPELESVGVIDLRAGRRVVREVPKRTSPPSFDEASETRKARAAVLTSDPRQTTDQTRAAVRAIDHVPDDVVDVAPRWSLEALSDLGLPDSVLHYVEAFAPVSDIEWLHALAGAIGRLLRDCAGPDEAVLVAGDGRASAVELIAGIPESRLPTHIVIDGVNVRATPDELALSIRECLS